MCKCKDLIRVTGCLVALLFCTSCSVDKLNKPSDFERMARDYYEQGLQKEQEGDYFNAMVKFEEAESLFDRFDDDSLKERILYDRIRVEESRGNYKQRADIILQAYEQSGSNEAPELVYYMAATNYYRAGETALADSLCARAKRINPEFNYVIPVKPQSVRDSLQRTLLSLYGKKASHAQRRSMYLSDNNRQLKRIWERRI